MQTLTTELPVCKNCDSPFLKEENFGGHCGQNIHIHPFTLSYLIHEIFHAFTHADKSILLLIKYLFLDPGTVLYEYIKAGKRKKYFNPFILIVLIGGLILFTTLTFTPPKKETLGSEKVIALNNDKSNRGELLGGRSQKFGIFMAKNSKFVMLSSIPIIAFVFWLGNSKKKFNYAEHLVANCFLTIFTILIYSIQIIPLIGFSKGSSFALIPTLSFLIFQIIYYGWAYRAFLKKMSIGYTFKPYLISTTAIVLWSVLSFSMSALDIYWPRLFA